MRFLNEIEQQIISGGNGVSLLVPVDPNAELNFSTGFNAGIDMVGGLLGFFIAIPCAVVILPAKGIYAVGNSAYNYFS
tara:strand:+ start:8826 stop:9059 length:234 start_codon:yes stop_codon:yes gene_type:complete